MKRGRGITVLRDRKTGTLDGSGLGPDPNLLTDSVDSIKDRMDGWGSARWRTRMGRVSVASHVQPQLSSSSLDEVKQIVRKPIEQAGPEGQQQPRGSLALLQAICTQAAPAPDLWAVCALCSTGEDQDSPIVARAARKRNAPIRGLWGATTNRIWSIWFLV